MNSIEAFFLPGTKNENSDHDLDSNDAPVTSRPGEELCVLEKDLLEEFCSKAFRDRLTRYAQCLFVFFRPFLPLLALDIVYLILLNIWTRNRSCQPGHFECVAVLAFGHAAFFHASAGTVERETAQFDDKEATTSGYPSDEKCAKAPLPGSSSSKNAEEEEVV